MLENGCQNGTSYLKPRVVWDFYKLFGSAGLCSENLRTNLCLKNKAATDDYDTFDNEGQKSITEQTTNETPNGKFKA